MPLLWFVLTIFNISLHQPHQRILPPLTWEHSLEGQKAGLFFEFREPARFDQVWWVFMSASPTRHHGRPRSSELILVSDSPLDLQVQRDNPCSGVRALNVPDVGSGRSSHTKIPKKRRYMTDGMLVRESATGGTAGQ